MIGVTDPMPMEPVYLGEHPALLKFYAMVRNPGDPPGIGGTFTLLGPDGVVALEAIKGDKGDPGTPGKAVIWQDSSITDPADLPTNLDETDANRAWWINNMAHVWIGTDWLVRPMGWAGPPGVTPRLTMSGESVGPTAPFEAIPSGTPEDPHIHLKVPTLKGDTGDNARILEAGDFHTPAGGTQVGQALVIRAGGGITSQDINPMAGELYSVPEQLFTNYSPGGSANRQQIATFTVPPYEIDVVPRVSGHLIWKRELFSSAQVIVEARLGDPATGVLLSRSLFSGMNMDGLTQMAEANFGAHTSDAGSPSRAFAPGTNVGRIVAGSTGAQATIYFSLVKIGGSGAYSFNNAGAQADIVVLPAS
ncbi:hypothetical protein [Mycobacteroides chelonae]|uniref:hypothetical protein n=1 Tax=Mycobacteroides chelonae TaxID=1774 RepID=UPI000994080C|nr:hypothetical protein [Mycobacteroides chelonae]